MLAAITEQDNVEQCVRAIAYLRDELGLPWDIDLTVQAWHEAENKNIIVRIAIGVAAYARVLVEADGAVRLLAPEQPWAAMRGTRLGADH
jgi:hypothetical protein